MDKFEPGSEVWDVKKIIMLVIIVGLGIFGLKTFVLDKNVLQANNSAQVEGTSTKSIDTISPAKDLQQSVQTGFDNLKNEVSNINVVEVATSTPAVQKVINDLKNLQNLPQSQAKDACLKICSGL